MNIQNGKKTIKYFILASLNNVQNTNYSKEKGIFNVFKILLMSKCLKSLKKFEFKIDLNVDVIVNIKVSIII